MTDAQAVIESLITIKIQLLCIIALLAILLASKK